jgi:dienelactone hydrolase
MVSGCSGFEPREAPTAYARFAENLKSQGYVVIFVDYLAVRRLGRCTSDGRFAVTPDDAGHDVLAAVRDLQSRPYVRKEDITAIGWSYGGGVVLAALRSLPSGSPGPVRRAIVYYPYCREAMPWTSAVPALLLLAGLDDVTPPQACLELAKRFPAGHPVEVRVYPEARHGFDASELPASLQIGPGQTMGYNRAAAEASVDEVLRFLRQ